ncbi:hypothetical protein NHG24_04045 [Aerococcaceae bacterium NML210727]|nr:hypothetical protein [Aerococcaceae bacterium NML210727]MCW6654544.1 hypothetical protein [Aerococcaceae bacterium NML201296]
MKETFPKAFYVKLSAIIVVFAWVYIQHAPFISATFQREDLSAFQAVTVVVQHLLNVQPNQRQSQQEAIPAQTAQTPRTLDEQVTQYPAYHKATEVAQRFNQQVDPGQLNQLFLAKVNQVRSTQGLPSVQYGEHLLGGVQERTKQLGMYHYFGNDTVDGMGFRTLFPMIDSAEYRLSEQLYEVYISATDIHLQTWENEDILAEYLLKAFGGDSSSLVQADYISQALYIYAEASDYRVETMPYVRLVVALVTDTMQ